MMIIRKRVIGVISVCQMAIALSSIIFRIKFIPKYPFTPEDMVDF